MSELYGLCIILQTNEELMETILKIVSNTIKNIS